MAFPKNAEEIKKLCDFASQQNVPCAILGAGTNVLAPDAGVQGLVICLKDCLDGIQVLEGNHLRVYAGVTMTRAAVFAASHNLSGLEFAHGIPGTVGGGVYMNAGAYGGEISQICQSVDVLTKDGEIVTYSNGEMDFSYRHSRLEEDGGIVLSAVFALTQKPEQEIRSRMQDLMKRRSASQPLDLPSAGSAFKRPVGGFAAALIDQAGLKGFRVGNAAVSEKHAGFVVNLGGATATDVKTLLEKVSCIVYDKSGIRLEPEMRIW
ncbi:MAG: UDP-N-acetylmuramate dehydrogenase [Oscillospiraceae bacterium]|nr:UDP-N-acetylmuramate dehydrogenase [Oscillospiraceae bacterium]